MKSYEFYGQLILRVPRFPKEFIKRDLQEQVSHPAFQDALYLASDSLHEELKKCNFDLQKCDERIKRTLKKYQHRICYRSTPFGGFASVSPVNWGKDEGGLSIRKNSFEIQVLDTLESQIDSCFEEHFQVNPALYTYGGTYRLYEGSETSQPEARNFKITEFDSDGLPIDILTEKGWLKKVNLLERLSSYGLKLDEAGDFLDELLENRLFVKVGRTEIRRLNPLKNSESSTGPGAGLYAHTSHTTDGSVNVSIQTEIRKGINALEHLCVLEEDTHLEKFKRRFISLFDRREIPLLRALDPEAGIDYGSNATWAASPKRNMNQDTKSIKWTQVHEVLLAKWSRWRDAGHPIIRLNDEDLKVLKRPAIKHKAPGMMALFSTIPGGIHLHAAGGLSGINMFGRLTIFDNELQEIARDIGEIEQSLNPDVIFAEVIHNSDELADKLNARHNVREMVIPVLTDCEKKEEHRLELNDLYLSVSNGTLILRSGRLNKRVIPRLSTAYNHRRETLSIYRFLCDLQHEDVQPSLNFSMSSLFPSLPFYPAVYYNNILLEPAKWQIDGKIFKAMNNLNSHDRFNAFRKLVRELNLPKLLLYEQHDQRLLLRIECPEDIDMLIETVKNQEICIFREYHDDKNGLVRDGDNSHYAHELVAIMINRERVYRGINDRHSIEEQHAVCFLTDWIYIKAYMNPSGMERFLINYFSPFINDVYKRLTNIQWYFIRYHDKDDHLRIRIKCGKGRELLLLEELKRFLIRIQNLPNLRSIELATYEKELERYAPIGILAAESLFCLSTKLVLKTITKFQQQSCMPFVDGRMTNANCDRLLFANAPDNARLIEGVLQLNATFQAAALKPEEVAILCRKVFEQLFENLNINKEIKISYDQEYRSMTAALNNIFDKEATKRYDDRYFDSLAAKLRKLTQHNRYKVLMDLNHLHLNRLFPHEPNCQEAKCYYYLYKQLIRQLKTARSLYDRK